MVGAGILGAQRPPACPGLCRHGHRAPRRRWRRARNLRLYPRRPPGDRGVKKQGLLSLTGIALLALIVLMTLQEWDYAAPPPPAARPDTPTLVLEQMQAQRHKPDGAIQYRLEASGLTWFEASDRSALDAPSVEMFGNKGRCL